jgi:acetyl-CoA acyltransferase
MTAVIVDAVRTATGKGKPGGALSGVHPVDLLAEVLTAVVSRNSVDPALIDDVIAGCVTQFREQSANVARQAVLAAGFPEHVPATTVDRQCGSSLQALQFAVQAVASGSQEIVIAAGVESMSRVPMLSSVGGADPYGSRLATRYSEGLVPQGISAELINARWRLGRARLDEFAARSHQLAAAAMAGGRLDADLIEVAGHCRDENVRPSTTAQSLAALRPAFVDETMAARFPQLEWAITAGNSSPLTDGAAAVLVTSEAKARELGLTIRARVTAVAVTGSDPLLMLTGVVPATAKVLAKARLTIQDIDAYEVNEAFAAVPLMWLAETGADADRLNQHGGALANGHPLGATGAKLLTTLLGVLEHTGGRRGLLTICEGGGMANALLIERD